MHNIFGFLGPAHETSEENKKINGFLGGGGERLGEGEKGGKKERILESTEKRGREFAAVKISEGEVN